MPKLILEEQDIIETKIVSEKSYHENLVNMNHVLETGRIPMSTQIGTGRRDQTMRVDWGRDDAFTRAFHDIEDRVARRVQQECAGLLDKKESWTPEQRKQWEENLSKIVSDEVAKTKGLETYRTIENGRQSAKGIKSLNDLSSDIQNGTHTKRFDCLIQSVMEGCLNQKMENRFLGEKAKSYFLAGGGVSFEKTRFQDGLHAAILTPAGSIIESTAVEAKDSRYSQQVYVRSKFPERNTLQDFVNGKPFYGENGSVYGQTGSREGKQVKTITVPGAEPTADTKHLSRLDRFLQSGQYVRVNHDDMATTTKPVRPAAEPPVKVSRPAPTPEPVVASTPNKSNPVLSIQEGLQKVKIGGDPLYDGKADGTWNSGVNQGFEQLVVMAQMTRDYAEYSKTHGTHVDGVYGPGTKKAMQAMADRGEIPQSLVNNIDRLHREHKLNDLYDGPHDVLGAMQNAKEYMPQNRIAANVAVTSAPTLKI